MDAVRSLMGSLGVILALVLLLLGLLLSPVLLPLAPLVLLAVAGWKLWRLKHKTERKVEHGRRRVRESGKKAGKKVEKALNV